MYKSIFTQDLFGKIRLDNFPPELSENFFKNELFGNGCIKFTTVNNNFEIFGFEKVGIPNKFYETKNTIVVNPYFMNGFDKLYKDDNEDNIYSNYESLSYNSKGKYGFNDIIKKYVEMIENIDKSINIMISNTRCIGIITATTNSEIATAKQEIKKISSGEPFLILKEGLEENIHINPLTSQTNEKMLFEMINTKRHYISSYYELLGIDKKDFEKKERMVSDETKSNVSSKCYLENCIDFCQPYLKKINEKYNLNIGISYVKEENKEETKEVMKTDESEESKE